MGPGAPKPRCVSFQRRILLLPFVALVLLYQCRPCNAGFSTLNILPHQKLHKGRGISEEQSSTSSPATVHKNLHFDERNQSHIITPLADKPAVPQLPSLSPALPAARTSPPPRSKRLDIVLTHFHPIRVQPALDFWIDFLESDKVQKWEPYVWVYCQNENLTNASELAPLIKYGGEVVHLENVGRESHSYLQHITRNYNNLAAYTLFSQDIPDFRLVERFERMFDNNTGFLPLSLLGRVNCKDHWMPEGTIPQLYSMLTKQLCPPEGYTGAFEGQFVVSKKRILAHDWWVYQHLLEMVAAPLDHWIHNTHDNSFYKDTSNPFFGHALERAWSLAFNCYESWRLGNCQWCDNDMHMEGCGTDACQCLDTVPEGMT